MTFKELTGKIKDGHKVKGRVGYYVPHKSEPDWEPIREYTLYVETHRGKIVLITPREICIDEFGEDALEDNLFVGEQVYFEIIDWQLPNESK